MRTSLSLLYELSFEKILSDKLALDQLMGTRHNIPIAIGESVTLHCVISTRSIIGSNHTRCSEARDSTVRGSSRGRVHGRIAYS